MYQPPLKKSYYRPKEEKLEMLIKAHESGQDVVQFGMSILDMSKRTAQQYAKEIISNPLIKFKIRGGTKHKKVTHPIHEFMVKLVSENNEIKLEEIRDRTLERYPYLGNIAVSTIWKHLDCQSITYKNMRYVSSEANTEENLQRRATYINFISSYDFYS